MTFGWATSVERKASGMLMAATLIFGVATPSYGQSFKEIIGGDRQATEARVRKMTPAARADARSAKELFARLSLRQANLANVGPSSSSETYNPRSPKRAAALRTELRLALNAYDLAAAAEKRDGVAVTEAVLLRLRAAVNPFVLFLEKARAAKGISRRPTLIVPAGQMRTFDLSAYCMDSSLGAPKAGETFRLLPAARLLPLELGPLYNAIMSQPGNHSYETQALVWALRNAYRNGAQINLSLEALARLEAQSPGATQAILDFNRRAGRTKAIRGLLDVVVPGARNLVTQVQALDPRRMIQDTAAQISNLERTPVAGALDADAAFTMLAPGVAARATSPWGGLSRARIEIANTSPQPYRLQPQQWVATSPRPSQHLALQTPAGYAQDENSVESAKALSDLYSKILDASALGEVKGAIQVIIGRDMVTGEDLPRWESLKGLLIGKAIGHYTS